MICLLISKFVCTPSYYYFTLLVCVIHVVIHLSDVHPSAWKGPYVFNLLSQVVASFSLLVYSLYGDELKEMFGYEDHHLEFYALGGIMGACIVQLHFLVAHTFRSMLQ